jgi:hypothetical protein
MANEKNIINVELYDLPITGRKDDRCGKVVSAGSLNEDDLIALAVARRTDLSAATMRAAMETLKEVALESIAGGSSVKFWLAYFATEVKGVFIGDHAKWDPKQHALAVHIAPTSEVRNAVKSATVNVRGMASSGTIINSLTDVATGAVNNVLTPGGGVNLAGSKIKIVGSDPSVGISLIRQDSGEAIPIPAGSILINDPSKVTFILPPSLSSGDYKLQITTQFSTSATQLNEPRICLFDYILTCN